LKKKEDISKVERRNLNKQREKENPTTSQEKDI
jgi:hypothetical protein